MEKFERLQRLAGSLLKSFTPRYLEDGTLTCRLGPGNFELGTLLVEEVQDGIPPDNYRYRFIREALVALYRLDTLRAARESITSERFSGHLTKWLASSEARLEYTNKALRLKWASKPENVLRAIQAGQLLEKREVFESVVGFLQDHIERRTP